LKKEELKFEGTETVNDTEPGVEPETVTFAGLKLQVTFAGRLLQAKEMFPLKPFWGVTLMDEVAVLPRDTVMAALPPAG
jgi:hypothetical protein